MLIIMNDAPYGSEKNWNALRLANVSCSAEIGFQVHIFLMGDSVTTAKKGQTLPEGYYNLENMMGELIAKGVEVRTCGTCMKTRGISDGELVNGAQRGTMIILAKWIKEADRVVSF